MNIFIDTSAFLAILNANDRFHPPAFQAWKEMLDSGATMTTSNYVLVETIAILQNRFGIEAVRLFEGDVIPVIEIWWLDQSVHEQAVSDLFAANRRDLSLVDCTSFDLMRRNGFKQVFTFDHHFNQQGFEVIPS
jgi:predicted nucleic acid-binding protein